MIRRDIIGRAYLLLLLFLLPSAAARADWADLEIDSGMGQYNYIEKDAANTGVHYWTDWASWSSSAVWVDVGGTGSSYNGSWMHDAGPNKHLSTASLNPANHGGNWIAGNNIDMYYKMDGTDKGTDVDAWLIVDVAKTDVSGNIFDSGDQLVLQFMIDIGNQAGVVLNRLWLENLGTLQESDDIGNDSVVIYTENAAALSFDGNETQTTLYGDYASSSTTNELWGHDALGISVPAGADNLCVYVVIKRFNANAMSSAKTANFKIIADGISFNRYGDDGNTANLCKMDATTNATTMTLLDDDTATPVISASTGVDTFRNCGFFVTTTATDTGAGLSASRSKVYFSWTSSITDSFYSVSATDLTGGVYSYTCPNNVASNEFTGKIGQQIYWFAYVADADVDANQGDADSKTASATGSAVILPLERDLVINELGRSGGASATGATAPGDYIEIYNRSGYSICIDSMMIQTRAQHFPPAAGTNSIANGVYYFLEDFETVTAAASDSTIRRLFLEGSDTVRLAFGPYIIDSAQLFTTDLSCELVAGRLTLVAQERRDQSADGLIQTNWQPGAKVFAGNSQGKDTNFAGTPKAANTDYSAIPIYISEMMDSSAASHNGDYFELYNAGADTYVLYSWSGYIGTTQTPDILGNFSCLITAGAYFLIEDNENATSVAASYLDPIVNGVLISGGTYRTFRLYGGPDSTYQQVDTAGASDGWKAGALGTSLEKNKDDLTVDGSVAANWGNSTGSLGNVTGTPKSANTFTPNATPAVYLANINTPTIFDKLYAGKQFKISAVYTDTDGAADLQRFDLRIGNGTDTIAMYAYRPAAGAAVSYDAGAAYVTAATVDSSFSGNDVTCTWNITLDWDFVEASTYKIGVRGADDSPETSAWTDSTLSWTYENDLVLSGTLANNQGITNGGFTTKINTSTTWSGLTVYYQGSSTISPADGDFDIQLTGQPGNTTQAAGAALSQAKTTRATDGVDYCTVTVINVTSGGSFVDATPFGMTFTVDATAPVMTVNRDSYTIKSSSGAMYGYQFNVDALDATTHIRALYVTKGTTDTEQVWGYTGTSDFQTNWRIDSIVYNALAAGHNSVYVTAVDSAGNFSCANIYISKEAITVNTDTTDWRPDELMDTRLNNRFRVTWDDTSLYFSYGGPAGDLASADLFVYILPDNAAGGSSTSIDWASYGTHTLPFAAKYAMCMDNATLSATNAEFQSAAGGVFSNTADYSNIQLSNGNNIVECRIGWNRLGGKPTSSLKIVAFHQWETARNVYNSYPLTNPAPNDASSVTFTDYYLWSALSDTVAPTIARLDSFALVSSASSVASAQDFNFTLTAKNAAGETLAGYNTPATLSTSLGTLARTTPTLVSGTIIYPDSLTSVTGGSVVCTATVNGNSAVLDTTTFSLVSPPYFTISNANGSFLAANPAITVVANASNGLDSIGYQIDGYAGDWKRPTSDGTTDTAFGIAGNAINALIYITTADWNALSAASHTIYFKVRDDLGTESGATAATAKGFTFTKDVTAPTLTVNRDSHTIKEDGQQYGYLFNVDFADGGSGLDSAWIERVNGATVSDTYRIFAPADAVGSAYTTNWRLDNTFTGALTNNAINVCKVRTMDRAGNVSTAGTIYIKKEILSAVDGDTSDWQDDEMIDQRKGNELRVGWDDTCLFFSYGGPDGSAYAVGGSGADYFFYIQTSGATTADSTYTPINWGGYGNVHKLPFGANYCAVIEGDYNPADGSTEDDMIVEFQKATAGSWGGNLQVDSHAYIGRHTSNNRVNEYRIAWSHLGGMPDSMLLIFYHEFENTSQIYNALPPGNPAGGASVVTFTDYYYIPILKDTISPMTSQKISNSPGRRRVDGDTEDWNWQNWPTADDTSLIKDSEFIWRAAINDERTDFADVSDLNFDLRTLRITGDTFNLYVLTVLQDLIDPNLLMQAISIDTDLVTSSGQQEIGGIARTRTVDTAEWEMCFLTNTSVTGWWNTDFSSLQTDGASYISAPNDVVELSIPWTSLYKSAALGDSLPRRVRFTFITGRKDASSTWDFMREASWDVTTRSRAVDAVDLAERKAPGGLFENEVLGTDTTLGYYFEVDFDSVGSVIPNRLARVSPIDTYAADSVSAIQLKIVDFNGNIVSNSALGANMIFSHTGQGNLVFPDSTSAWSSGLKTVSLRYDGDETITITCTETLRGRSVSFTVGFYKDTTLANAWYVNDNATSSDSFTSAVGAAANRGLSRWAPALTLDAVIPFLSAGDSVYIDAGTFTPATSLSIPCSWVYIRGVDSTLTIVNFADSSSGSNRSFGATGFDSITVRDLRVRNAYNGLLFTGTDTVVLINVRASTCGSAGFRLQTATDSDFLVNCHADSNAGAGFWFSDANYLRLVNCSARDNAETGFAITNSSDSVLISGCAATSNREGFRIDNSLGARLSTCTATSQILTGFVVVNASSTAESITGCLAASNGTAGFYVSSASAVQLCSNTVSGGSAQGFHIIGSSNVLIRANRIMSAGTHGVHLSGAGSNIVESNVVVTAGGNGFLIEAGSDTNTIRANTAQSATQAGFEVDNADGNLFSLNFATGGSAEGFRCDNGAESTSFVYDSAQATGGAGFRTLGGSIRNQFRSCTTLSTTGAGFSLEADTTTVLTSLAQSAGTRGFVISSANFNTLTNCTAAASGDTGFLVSGDSNTLTLCASLGAGGDGFEILNGSFNTLRDNRSDTSTASGYAVAGTSTRNLVLRNAAQFSKGSGFRSAADGNTFHANRAHSGMTYGFTAIACDLPLFIGNQSDSNNSGEFRFEAGVTNATFTRNNMSLKTGGTTLVSTAVNDLAMTRNWWGTRDSVTIASYIAGTGVRPVHTPYRLGAVDTALLADTVAPLAPDSVSANATGMETIVIRWSAVTADEDVDTIATGLTGYRIWRAFAADSRLWNLHGAVGSGTTQFTDTRLSRNTLYCYRITAYDEKSTWPNESFYSDTIARDTTLNLPTVLLSEIGVSYSTSDVDSDFIELYIKDDAGRGAGADLSGWKIYTFGAGASRILRKTLGNMTVRTGSFVTLYFDNDAAQADEVSDAGDSRVTTYTTTSNGIMPTTELLIELEGPDAGNVADAVCYGNTALLDATIATRLQTLVDSGLWSPDNTAANIVSKTYMNLEGNAIRRDSLYVDNNTKNDWSIDSQTPGNMPIQRYIVTSDSAAPHIGAPFNLTLWAIDGRGDSVVNTRVRPQIAISDGTISPTRAAFLLDPTDLIQGTAGETTIPTTITGTYDTRTITVTNGGLSCTVAVVVSAPLDSFVLTAPSVPHKVIRNDSFGLRVRATNIFGGTVSFFTGTVNLSVSNGTIIPSSVTFIGADLGDTTIQAQVSGIGYCSITASASNKTGTTVVIPVPDTRLVISEVLFNDADRPGGGNIDRDEFIEIYNRGTTSKSLANHTLWIRPLSAASEENYTFPSLTVPAGKFVVVHFNKWGTDDLNFNDTDGAAHLYGINSSPAMSTYENIIPHSAASNPNSFTLYDSTTQDSRTVIDFLGIDAGATTNASLHDTHANQAGLWVKYATLNFPTTATDNIGRSFYRKNEDVDSDGTSANEWSTIDGSTDSYRYTDGYSNKNNVWPSGAVTISCSTTSSPLLGDTIAAGDTIYIWLSASTDGDAAAANTTNVFVYSDTDPTGIVVTLKETGNNTKLFYGEALVATTPLESNDGMRIIVTQPGDSVTIQWVGSTTVKRSTTSTGSIHHFNVSPSASSINQGDALTLTITAQDLGNWTVTSFTGTCTITLSDSRTYPDTVRFITAGAGETSISVIFGAAPGTITCTVTSAGGITGTTVITVIADTDVLINEIMANVGVIDWTGNTGTTEADEWVELYNKGMTNFSIAGYKLRPTGSAASITLAGSIPPKGYVTVYRGTANTGKSHHYDSAGVISETNINLVGNFSTELVDAGGSVELLDPLNTIAAKVTYVALDNDSSYGRAPDGTNAWHTFKRPTPGLYATPSPDNLLSPNARFRFDAPDTVVLNSAFTLVVALTSYNGDTITTFLDTATIRAESSGTLTPTSLAFTNGVSSTSITYTGGNNNETSIIAVFTYGAISGRDTVGLRTVTVSRETTQVNVEQAIADGIDTSIVQVIAMTAAGTPLAGLTVTISSSKGSLDTIVPSSAITNAAGYCSFTVVSRDTNPSKITAVVDGLTAFDSPSIYWLDPVESGVQTSFGTKTTILTVDDDSHFILFPQWRRDGKALAWVAKTAAVDTWAIYTAFDDGAHGDGAANDGTFTTYQVTHASHNVFQGSKIAFADILKADGSRCAAGEAGDSAPDVIFSANNGSNRRDLYVVRSAGEDLATAKASLVRLTANEGTWTMPAMVSDDTIYAIFQGSVYRLHGKGAGFFSVGGGSDKILEGGTVSDFMINGKSFAAVDIALYDSNVMAVTMLLNMGLNDSNTNKRSEILIITGVETAGYRQWTSPSASGSCKLVQRPDSGVAWNLSWDTGGRALSWARDITGTFNWILVWTRPRAPEAAYLTSDFDVEATYVTETWFTPNRPVSLINNKGGMNDQSACFSMGSTARVAYASYDTRLGQVKLNIADIDGVTVVDQNGGLLFQNGRLTAVVDEGDNLSGSVEIKVQRPTSAPSNGTPESIALTGNAREFFPNGKTFDDSITVILYYDAADLTAANVTNGTAGEYSLRVYWYNPTSSVWEDYNAIVDPTDRNGALGSLTFQTNHFSIYGVGFAPEHPNRPDPIAPAQNSTVTTRSPVFSWRHNDPQSRPQIGFQIEIATDSNFTAVVLAEARATADTTVTLSALLPTGESTLYWRVRTGAIANAYGSWSLGDSAFITSIRTPSAPSLVSPSNGAETRTARPVFRWLHSDPDGDTQSKAQVEIATDSAFTAPIVSNILETFAQSLQIDATLADGLYWWRVRTADANGFGGWSTIRGVIVNTLPLAPSIVTAPAAITHPTPSFAWTHSDPEGRPQTAYRIILSTDSGFTTTLLDLIVDTSAATSTLSGDRALAIRGTNTVHYRLSTAASGRSFGPTTQSSFTATLNPPAAPALLSPNDNTGTTASSITFAWTHNDLESDTQTGYALRISRDTSFATPLYIEELPGAITSRTLTLSLSGGLYYWQAATRDAVDRGAWSAIRAFTWTGETGPLTPILSSPAEASSIRTPQPTFQWTHRDRNSAPQSGALLEIARGASFSPIWRSRVIAGTSQTVTLDASDSLYQPGESTVYWRVRTASFGSDYGTPSAESSFVLRTSIPSVPTLLAPADGSSTRLREVEFEWRSVSVHDSLPQTAYEFQIARNSGLVSPVTHSGLDDPSIVLWLTGGNSFWRVRTATIMGWSLWSESRVITIDTHPYAPTQIEPVAGTTLSSPRPLFRWAHNDPTSASQKGALIEIASDSTFTSIVRSAVLETTSASWRPRESESIPLEGNHTIFWRIRTSNAGGDYGPASGDTAFNVTLNRPMAPTASTPFDTTRDIRPLFTWVHNDPDADPEIGVRIQVARDSGFASPLVDATWETTVNNLRFASSLTSGNWAWRIATRDEVGWGPWSGAKLFTVDTSPLWRSLRITSGRLIPTGETRSVAIEFVTETGVPVAWPPSAAITIGSRILYGVDFVSDTSIGRIGLLFDTPGAWPISVREDAQTGSDTLTVIARPSSATSSDTYCFLYGRNGAGQRVIEDDTRLTVILRALVSDTRYKLRVSTTVDTLLIADTDVTSVDSGLIIWSGLPVSLTGGGRIIARVYRDSVLVSSEIAIVLARPTRALIFRESETGTGVLVEVPAGACDTPLFITVSRSVADFVHRGASDAARRNGRKYVEGSVVEITATDIDGRSITSFLQNLSLKIPAAAGPMLRIAFLKDGAWIEIDSTTWDSATQQAIASTNHLTVWGVTVGTLGPGSVQNIRVYPNPWRSDGPTGSLVSSNTAYGAKFDQMPSGQVRIRVFTVAGELVLDGTLDPALLGATAAMSHLHVVDVGGATGQVARWDLKNQHGEDVASGLYMIVFEGPGGRATRRFAVIR